MDVPLGTHTRVLSPLAALDVLPRELLGGGAGRDAEDTCGARTHTPCSELGGAPRAGHGMPAGSCGHG